MRGRDFLDRSIDRWVLPIERNRTIVDMTEFGVNINERDRRVVNDGVDLDLVRRQTDRPVERMTLKDATRPGEERDEGGDLVISKPVIRRNEAAKPKEVVDQDKAERKSAAKRRSRIYRRVPRNEEEIVRQDHEQGTAAPAGEPGIRAQRDPAKGRGREDQGPESRREEEGGRAGRVPDRRAEEEARAGKGRARQSGRRPRKRRRRERRSAGRSTRPRPGARPDRRGQRGRQNDSPSRDRSQGGAFFEEDEGEEDAVDRLERAQDARRPGPDPLHAVDEQRVGRRRADNAEDGDEGPVPPRARGARRAGRPARGRRRPKGPGRRPRSGSGAGPPATG